MLVSIYTCWPLYCILLKMEKEILDNFCYNENTGVITKKDSEKQVGYLEHIAEKNYSRIKIDFKGKHFLYHRIAWLLFFKEWPSQEIDHRDGNPLNNKIENLRLATRTQNCQNQRLSKVNKVGLKGVQKRSNLFRSRIQVNKKSIHLGYFKTREEAHLAYQNAARHYFSDFSRFK